MLDYHFYTAKVAQPVRVIVKHPWRAPGFGKTRSVSKTIHKLEQVLMIKCSTKGELSVRALGLGVYKKGEIVNGSEE